MRLYLDTSLLVPLYALESRTADAQNWMAGLEGQVLAVSLWVDRNWRMTFKFEGNDAVLTDYQDYH